MIGETIGHYRIVGKLGEGGMGVVYVAEDTKLDRRVALKVLPAELAENPERLDRFQREAKALAALDHPNIVTIHSVEEEGEIRFFTMQLIDGQPLSELIPQDGVPAERLFKIAVPLADALANAHAKGIIHRDLKPSNVMVTGEGRVMVLDFGLAKLWQEAAATETSALPTEPLTAEGRVVGTIPYMSPEQLEGKELDARTDLFSMGVMLYEMATGNRPFQGDTSVSLMSSIVKDTPPPLDTMRPELPNHLGRIIQRCLEKDPKDRYQTMRDAALELRNLEKEMAGTRSSSMVVPASSRRSGITGHRSWLGGLAMVLVLAMALLGIWKVMDSPNESSPVPEGPASSSASRIRDPQARAIYERAQRYRGDAESVTRWDLAEATLRQAVEMEPDNAWLLSELADLLVERQDLNPQVERKQEATDLVERALEIDTDLATAWVVKGRLAKLEGDHEAAMAAAQKARALDPTDPQAAYLLGLTLIRQGSKEEGMVEVHAAADLDPDPVNRHFQTGFALQQVGRLDEAILEFRQATEFDPGHASALNNLAVCYFWMGRYREAVPVFRRLLEIRPEDKSAANNLGTVYYYLDRMDEAVEAYELAHRLNPGDPMIQNNLGDTHAKLGNREEAHDWYRQAISSADESLAKGGGQKGLLELKYLCQAKVGEFEQATTGAAQLADDYPGDFSVLYTAAQVHALAADKRRLLDYTERAIRAGCPREEFGRAPEFAAFHGDPEFEELLASDLDSN